MTVGIPVGSALRAVGALIGAFLVVQLGMAAVAEPFSARYALGTAGVVVLVLLAARVVLVESERPAWAVLTLGIALWLGGTERWLPTNGDDAVTGAKQALTAVSFGAVVVALGMFVVARRRPNRLVGWLDAIVAAGTVGAAALWTFDLVGAQATRYPLETGAPGGGLVLVVALSASLGMVGWRPGPSLGLLSFGLALASLAGVALAADRVDASSGVGQVLVGASVLAMAAIGVSAWVRPGTVHRRAHVAPWLEGLIPGGFAFVALLALIAAALTEAPPLAVILLGLGPFIGGVRAALLFRDNVRLSERSRREARQDHLTGLPNRRALIADLHDAATRGSDADPLTLAFFDLDGFKFYNDTFGHGAGDALLQRMAGRLSEVLSADRVYRLGGDEFCALVVGPPDAARRVIDRASEALSEHGDGFVITASVGSVTLPTEVTEPEQALRIADQRMYARKAERRGPVRMQARDLLLAVVRETEPDLDGHNDDVGRLTRQLGARIGLHGDALDIVVKGAELHDIGKVAIPDELLNKPSDLDDEEWRLMRQHTLIGERILAASPGLGPVAELVRASHERWDGTGYPDGLAGPEIPLGARIITVCDSFDAMVSDRPYSPGLSIVDALAELERCAGSQFDPEVVEVFASMMRSGDFGLGVQRKSS